MKMHFAKKMVNYNSCVVDSGGVVVLQVPHPNFQAYIFTRTQGELTTYKYISVIGSEPEKKGEIGTSKSYAVGPEDAVRFLSTCSQKCS